jgi:uncharacterized protein YbjT (DUF2867 family)
MDMAETILVTGATGIVESEVIKQLSRATTDINIKAAVHSAENVKGARDSSFFTYKEGISYRFRD